MRTIVGTIFLVGGALAYLYIGSGRRSTSSQTENTSKIAEQVSTNVHEALVDDEAAAVETPRAVMQVACAASSARYSEQVAEVLRLAPRLGLAGTNVRALNAQVESLARRITLEDARQLQTVATTGAQNHAARYLSVYLLSQRPQEFAAQLEAIAAAKAEVLAQAVSPHTTNESQRHFEEALRAQALSALDSLSATDARELAYFKSLEETSPNPFLRKLARMGAVGAQNGQTLISQYINADL